MNDEGSTGDDTMIFPRKERHMPAQKLREFFREKSDKADSGKVNWQARKDSWIRAVDKLYEKINKVYLAASIRDGTVKPSLEDQEVRELGIGVYHVKNLVLQVGGETVIFFPKGTNIFGATGRIDLHGIMGDVAIIRQPGDRWSVVLTRTPTLKMVPLNEESLLAALKMVMQR
jgi:hypothetical protein